jgi:hypothetical protein
VKDTGVLGHVVGHGTALADEAVVLQENDPIFTFDHDTEAGSSSRIERLAGAIEPGKDSWFF